MHDQRYSVFISSTFEDLRDERQAVQDVVISAGDFPVQMESFPAVDEDQFEFIKALIDKCDYYVLIVAGRYGTPADDGISYTEKEYHYAISRDIPVLVMLHGDRGKIHADKTENSDNGKIQLEKFISQVSEGRLRKGWTTTGELQLAVRESLDHVKATNPGIGWVRGDITASAEIMVEINNVRKENAKYREAIGSLELELELPPIPDADEDVKLDLLPLSANKAGFSKISGTYARIKCTWISAFPLFYSVLSWRVNDWDDETKFEIKYDETRRKLGAAYASEFAEFDTSELFTVSPNSFERLMSYYYEIGLMTTEGTNPFTEIGKRLARRQIISDANEDRFSIVKGEISKIEIEEEIPF